MIATGAVGAGWYGWTLGSSNAKSSALAMLGGALLLFLWSTVYASADPEPKYLPRFQVPGRALIGLEFALIIAGGAALWMAWHRAAGETYMTVAFIDLAVRYHRLPRLWRNEPHSAR
ncbi:MAG: hypothetical protein IT334_10905 [Thermomicrobiales bacterium]|nr:hypothetical protein [Thermomicrobiales bacterium]